MIPRKPRAWVYARVSTQEQATGGYSLEAQTRQCLAYIDRFQFERGDESNVGTPGVFVDGGQSATKKMTLCDRPGGRALLSAVRPGDHVICTTPSRMFRSLRASENQLHAWAAVGVFIHFLDIDVRTDTANGRLMLQVMCALAEWKGRIIGERTRESKAWRKAGKVPPKKRQPAIPKAERAVTSEAQSGLVGAVLGTRYAEKKQIEFNGVTRAYVRVSTDFQTAENQIDAIATWFNGIERSTLPVPPRMEIYDDSGYSAYTSPFHKRPAGRELLSSLRPGDTVVASRADRLFRSQQDLLRVTAEITAKGARLVLLDCNLQTDTPFGEMMLRMLGILAEFESREISRTSRAGRQASIIRNQKVPLPAITVLCHETPNATLREERPDQVILRQLMTPDEWRGYCWLIWHQVSHGHAATTRQIPKKNRTFLEQGNLSAAVDWANKAYEAKLGWPHFPRRSGSGTRVRDAIRMVEQLQQKEFSLRRRDLLNYLRTKSVTLRIHGAFLDPTNAYRRLRSYAPIRQYLDKTKDLTLAVVLSQGPMNSEKQLAMME
jgi:DNA invertase Pin-like site-specific DNA recombinase